MAEAPRPPERVFINPRAAGKERLMVHEYKCMRFRLVIDFFNQPVGFGISQLACRVALDRGIEKIQPPGANSMVGCNMKYRVRKCASHQRDIIVVARQKVYMGAQPQ